MGLWIAVVIVLFVIGSIMALKPSGVDMRVDNLRMTARKLELNPKLIACPEWIRGKDNQMGKGMMGQYSVIFTDIKLPYVRYHVIDGEWRPVLDESDNEDNAPIKKASFSLDQMPLDLPSSIQPFVKGLMTKANSISIYWDDVNYVRPASNPNYNKDNIEHDLLILKEKLAKWGEIVNNG